MATAARLTIAVFGLDQSQEHETGTRSIVALPGVQEQLLEKLAVRNTTGLLVSTDCLKRRRSPICVLSIYTTD